jgi:hypothetical protein
MIQAGSSSLPSLAVVAYDRAMSHPQPQELPWIEIISG